MSMSRRSGTPRDRATTRSGHAATVTVVTTVVAAAAKPHANDAVATKAAAVAAHAVDATVDAVVAATTKPHAVAATAAATTSGCTRDVNDGVTVRNVGGEGMRRRRTSTESWGGIKLI